MTRFSKKRRRRPKDADFLKELIVLTPVAGLILTLMATGCTQPRYAQSGVRAASRPSDTNGSPLAVNRVAITNHLDPAWLQPPGRPFTLGPGDRLEIELLGEPASRV